MDFGPQLHVVVIELQLVIYVANINSQLVIVYEYIADRGIKIHASFEFYIHIMTSRVGLE